MTAWALLSSLLCASTFAADPSGGWLSYARYKAPKPTDVITKLSATMVVPDTPSKSFGSPAFWFGVQTDQGDGALIQPIMAKWLGDGFYMFQEIFDWTDENDKQSDQIKVQPGDVISASVTFAGATDFGINGSSLVAGGRTYTMNMTSGQTGKQSDYSYTLLPKQTATESVAYFVLEHQPSSCGQLPPNGNVTWTDIAVEVNGAPVASPMWEAMEESPACGSKAIVHSPSSVGITWTA